MKMLTLFLAIVVLLTLISCGDDFDAEAEKEAVIAASVGIDDGLAIGDREAVLAAFHDDMTFVYAFPDEWGSWNYQDIGPDRFTEPAITHWNDYEVFVSSDLAVIRGERTNQVPGVGQVPVLATEVFKKENGQWKLIHFHTSYSGQ